MHDVGTRQRALELLAEGLSRREVCRRVGVGYTSLYRWEQRLQPLPGARAVACFRCESRPPADSAAYLYLLGQYLGDGHIRRSGRTVCLSISCCTDYPGIISDVEVAMRRVFTASVFHRRRNGGARCVNVEANTIHWPCAFPQQGPGKKHARPIVLEPWQVAMVDADPRPLIRGLIHSDGCRVTNWTERRVGDTVKRYEYPRYFFSNRSPDIRAIFTGALDRLSIPWRYNLEWSISIAQRRAVAALDGFVGPKR